MPAEINSLGGSKLIKFLRELEKEDWNYFCEYMRSPFFRKNPWAIKLFLIIEPLYPEFEDEKLGNEDIFHQISPHEKFNKDIKKHKASLNNYCNYLLKDIRTCIAFIEFKSATEKQESLIREGLWIRGFEGELEKLISKSRKELTKEKKQDIDSCYALFDLEMFAFRLNRTQSPSMGEFHTILNALDAYTLAERFRILCLLMQVAIRDPDGDLNLAIVEREVVHYQDSQFSSSLSEVFYHLMSCLWYIHDKDEIDERFKMHFQAARLLCNKLLAVCPKEDSSQDKHPLYEELTQVFDLTNSICMIRFRSGELTFHQEMYVLHRQWMEWNLLQDNGRLHHQYYKNLITLAVRENDISYAKEILKSYKDKLYLTIGDREIDRDKVYLYNLAHIAMYEHSFAELNTILTGLKGETTLYKESIYVLKLQAAIEESIHTQQDLLERYNKAHNSYQRYLKDVTKKNENRVLDHQFQFLQTAKKIFDCIYEERKIEPNFIEEVQKSGMKEKLWLVNKIKQLA